MGSNRAPVRELTPASSLLSWYDREGRDLPWRHTTDPYRVLVSEVMLQQTRADVVCARYERFLTRFPDIQALAEADEKDVLKEWEGLGYYARARNLHKAARFIVNEYDGRVPAAVRELKQIPGIGSYTAGAVSSIAFGEPEPAIDANVVRIMSRILAIEEPKGSAAAAKRVEERMRAWLPVQAPGEFAQAMMDLGSMICRARNPLCGECPLAQWCDARRRDAQGHYPVRAASKVRREEQWTALLVTDGRRMGFERRPDRGLLGGMYGPPLLPGAPDTDAAATFVRRAGLQPSRIGDGPSWTHVFSHVRWEIRSLVLHVTEACGDLCPVWATRDEIRESIAVPSAFRPLVSFWVDQIAQTA